MAKAVNYLGNKCLLEQIWKSKLSYCEIYEPEFVNPDVTVYSDDIAKRRLDAARATFDKKAKGNPDWSQFKPPNLPTLDTVTEPNLTVRFITDEHIDRSEKAKKGKLGYLDGVTFDPFILYRSSLDENGKLVFHETARSHWQGGSQNGWFTAHRGKITDRLARSMMLLVDRIALKPNFRGYSYVSEMKSEALVNLSANLLKFDETLSNNPFSYMTTSVNRCFIRYLKDEKQQQDIRDDLLEMAGALPSITRQVETEVASLTQTSGKRVVVK